MSFLYDDGHMAIATESRRVLDARMNKDRLLKLLEQVGHYDEVFWQTATEQGWTALAIPEEYGGLGLGLIELGLVAQATGAHTAGAPFLTVGYGAARALLHGTDESLKEEWLPQLASGEKIATVAFADASAPLPPASSVRFENGMLSGTKNAVVGGARADIALVWAQHGEKPALFLADLSQVPRNPVNSFDNSRLYADLVFDGSPARLVADGTARQIALEALAAMAIVSAHEQLGGAEELLMMARDYALTRRAFGQPIGGFQSIKHKIAELYGLVELARANCIHAAASDGRESFLLAAADVRIAATEAYDTAARDCTQIHGGIGVTWEQGLHLHMRRARSLAIEQGNLLFWEDLLVEQITGVAA